MSALTTSIKIKLVRINPGMGPALQIKIWINDTQLTEIALEKEYEYYTDEAPVRKGENSLIIQHLNRQHSNTKVDSNGLFVSSSMVKVDDIRINKVFFWPGRHSLNSFIPEYDSDYVRWCQQHKPDTKFPAEIPAQPLIGINGKLKIKFIWPLEMHGLYYNSYYDPHLGQTHSDDKVKVTDEPGTVGADVRLYVRRDCPQSGRMNEQLTKLQVPFEIINVDQVDNKIQQWFNSQHKETPQLYKKDEWIADMKHFGFVDIKELLP